MLGWPADWVAVALIRHEGSRGVGGSLVKLLILLIKIVVTDKKSFGGYHREHMILRAVVSTRATGLAVCRGVRKCSSGAPARGIRQALWQPAIVFGRVASVGSRPLCMVDNDDFNRPFRGLQFQPELFVQRPVQTRRNECEARRTGRGRSTGATARPRL